MDQLHRALHSLHLLISVSDMKFLVTNDDGIDALGLAALVPLRAPLANQSWSPRGSPIGRQPRRYLARASASSRVDESRFAIHGTPADCTRLGLLHLVPEAKWILSGINHGANLGADVYYSGTVAAVREALLHGWPGIAFSHYRKSGIEFDWLRATRWITPVLAGLVAKPIEPVFFTT